MSHFMIAHLQDTTSVMYEGTPETPHRGRWWEIVAEVRRDDPLHRARP